MLCMPFSTGLDIDDRLCHCPSNQLEAQYAGSTISNELDHSAPC